MNREQWLQDGNMQRHTENPSLKVMALSTIIHFSVSMLGCDKLNESHIKSNGYMISQL